MSKQAEIFYVNYEFDEQPINGVEQMTEDQLFELMEAYAIEYHLTKIKKNEFICHDADTYGKESKCNEMCVACRYFNK